MPAKVQIFFRSVFTLPLALAAFLRGWSGDGGSQPEGVYGKDMISVQATACTENQWFPYRRPTGLGALHNNRASGTQQLFGLFTHDGQMVLQFNP